MKKIIALVVALVMMAAIAVPAFAAETTLTGNSATAGGTKLIYGTSQSYTVTIPPQIELAAGTNSEAQTVSISNYKLATNKRVSISIDSANVDYYTVVDGNAWYLVEASAEYEPIEKASKKAADVPYTVFNGGTAEGNKVLRGATIVYADSTASLTPPAQTTTLVFHTVGTSEVAYFTDTVSFTATVGDKPLA